MQYRAEIDGLRAIAVTSVILFHANYQLFRGGYLGVDIFFVISGFLITSIIINDLQTKSFSILNFYERRARRILPALFVVVACSIPFAVYWMLPSELSRFGSSIIAVTLFVSNIFFRNHSGYFDSGIQDNPLFHTWSLAVEEQFYLLFPLSMLALWRFGRNPTFYVIIVVALISLAISEWASRFSPIMNFYFLTTRAWELLLGSICAFIVLKHPPKPNDILSFIGLSLIGFSIFYFDENTRIPSIIAILPVGGTALILLYGTKGSLIARILSFRILTGVGLISYSAYLWHQPLFAFQRIGNSVFSTDIPIQPLILLTFVLAYLTWRFVERPFRAKHQNVHTYRKPILATLAVVGFGLLFIGLSAQNPAGFLGRVSSYSIDAKTQRALDAENDIGKYMLDCLTGTIRGWGEDEDCHLGNSTKRAIDFAIVGDSFAGSIADGIGLAALGQNKRGVIIASESCPPFVGLGGDGTNKYSECEPMQDTLFNMVERSGARTVFLVGSWGIFYAPGACQLSKVDCSDMTQTTEYILSSVQKTITGLIDQGLRVYIVGSPPNPKMDAAKTLARNYATGNFGELEIERTSKNHGYWNQFLKTGDILGATFIPIIDYFCDADTCHITADGIPRFYDDYHITKTVSQNLAPYYENALGE